MTYSVVEFDKIGCAANLDLKLGPIPNEITLPQVAFESLKAFALNQTSYVFIRFFVQKGREFLQVKNYVGLIETPDGMQLEVLPKMAKTPAEGRALVLQMLRCLPDKRFKKLPVAHLATSKMPLWEIFIGIFIEEIEELVRQGLQKCYTLEEENSSFLRGKLLINQQLSKNRVHQERFAIAYDAFLENTAPNRVLKAAILALQTRSRTSANQIKLRQLRFIFDQVPVSTHPIEDLAIARRSDRRFDRYATALQWAEVLLRGQSWVGQSGAAVNVSLLFPMEQLFEAYVSAGIRKYRPHYEVIMQDRSHYLVVNHAGQQRFGLRPDLVLRRQNQTIVLDTKWKWIDATNTTQHYGIEQSDLYQLYAYGQKYGVREVYLIYPQSADFQKPLPVFHFQESLQLRVLPFNLSVSLPEAVAQLAAQLND
jgi:5-methylcytosine-specific restriction enzyme subunit McrC